MRNLCRSILFALMGTACAGDTSFDLPTQTLKGTAESLSARTSTERLDLPKQVYKKAYDQARKDINASNARTFLEQLDSQIEREKDMMR